MPVCHKACIEEEMRVLLINVALNSGSTGRIVEGIGCLAVSQGWDVYVAHGARYVNKSRLKNYQITTKAGEAIHYLESSLFDAQGRGSRLATKRFLKYIDRIRPDVVHIHNIHGCFLNYPKLFNYLHEKEIPVIWTLHDCWSMTGHCVHFEKTHCDRWLRQCENCPQKQDFPSSFLLDRSKSNYLLKKQLFSTMERMRITTVSEWLKGVALQSYLKELPIDVVPNGIDIGCFVHKDNHVREEFRIGDKKLLLAVASGFEERKGINDFVRLSKLLPAEFQIMLVGTNKSDRKALPESIITVPRTSSVSKLVAIYSAADVLLSLSYEETFGLTIVEAMSCGTPAIVYDNTAQPELITPETGRVVATGDVDSLVSSIKEVCSLGKAGFSQSCRERALLYDEKRIYQKYIGLYEEETRAK